MANTVYNTKKEKLKNQLSDLNQKQFDKAILKSIGNNKLETFTMWQDPTIEEYQKEIARLNKIIDELEKEIKITIKKMSLKSSESSLIMKSSLEIILDTLKELKEESYVNK